MSYEKRSHLAGRDRDHASLCNVKARRWRGRELVKVEVKVVDEETFNKMRFQDKCGRCYIAQCARDGVPIVRQ